ncbi:hypothetical protein KFL_004420020 [Klebsormidium nitens]|uniref:Uncharacterized protein n=1 Tax=Klebsormidium nitens TaxID=105231 RepID=A0A1Y1IIV5_KLENI|nr:hypothetical protein KFL_004420020 [Klebsormidium nitens]|eukprot:GAQ88587.1 hypothetical protein KFL_004420020 [Klebsormidium nitens]
MTVQEVAQAERHQGPIAPAAEMEQMHLREAQGGAAPQRQQTAHTASENVHPKAGVASAVVPQTESQAGSSVLTGGAERKLAEHNDYEEGLLRAAHEKKRAHEAEAFLAAETKKAQALAARKAADADAEVKLAAAKAAEKLAKTQYKLELKVDKAHEKFEKKAAIAVEQAEFKKAAAQEHAEEEIVAAMEKAEHVRAGEEVLKPSLAQKIGLKKKDF